MPAPTINDAIETSREPEDIAPADLPSVLEGLRQAKRSRFASTERVAELCGRSLK